MIKKPIYYIYILFVIVIAILLSRPILNTQIHPSFTYILLAYSPLFFLIRGIVNLKYKEKWDYLGGILLLVIILIFRWIYR